MKTYKSVDFTIVALDGTRATRTVMAEPGRRFNGESIEILLHKQRTLLWELFPGVGFREVALATGGYSFIEQEPNAPQLVTPDA